MTQDARLHNCSIFRISKADTDVWKNLKLIEKHLMKEDREKNNRWKDEHFFGDDIEKRMRQTQLVVY